VLPRRVEALYQAPPEPSEPAVLEADDETINTAMQASDFHVRQSVQAWWRGQWYAAVVHYVGHRSLTLTFQGEPHIHENGAVCTSKHRVSAYNPSRVREPILE